MLFTLISLRFGSKAIPKREFPKGPGQQWHRPRYEYSLEGLLLYLDKYALLCLLKDE